jgi:hypothetical protein
MKAISAGRLPPGLVSPADEQRHGRVDRSSRARNRRHGDSLAVADFDDDGNA